MAELVTAKIGQIWRDADPRITGFSSNGRYIVILDIQSQYAKCCLCDRDGNQLSNRKTMIRIDRLKPGSTGYEFVKEAGR